MKFKAVFYLLGRLLFLMGAFLALPAGVSAYYGEHQGVQHFLMVSAVTLTLGLILFLSCRGHKDDAIAARDGFLLVTLSWLVVSFLGAFPFYLSEYFVSFVDAFFEATSGFTTTGASVLSDIESLDRGLLFWRNFSQWIGGMGIVVLAIAVLPQLSIGGMQLMKNEMPGPTFEQLKPRLKQTALSLWKIYVLFSAVQVVLLYLFGMPLFESFCHMFGTMSTGGFSPKNASIAEYAPMIQMIICFFMLLSGANFVLHYTNLHGEFEKMFKDNEWQFFMGLLLIAFVLIVVNLIGQADYALMDALRLSLFQVVSLATTTGFGTDDFEQWPYLSKGILFLLMFVGGCAGSTSGGIKQVRLLLLFKKARQSIVQHIFPKAVISIKLNTRAVSESILHGISSFFLIYIVIFSFCTIALLAFNIDFVTATSAVVASLSNIGPGFGDVGATQNYAFLPSFVKILLCACMVIGRLEIFTVLVLFFPATWRR